MGLSGLKSRMICVSVPLLTFSFYETESKMAGLYHELWTLAQHEAASPRSPQPGHGSPLSFLSSALQRYNWHTHFVKLGCTRWWSDTGTYYEMFTTVRLVNTSVATQNYHVVVVMVIMFMFSCHSNFQVCHRTLLTIVSMWYIRSPELISRITRSLYPLTNIAFSPSLSPWSPPFYSLLLWVWHIFLDPTYEWCYRASVFLCLAYFA